MSAVFKREFSSYMHSTFGVIFIALMLLVGGASVTLINLFFQNGDINPALEVVMVAMILFVPLLSMRSFAEDKRSGTDKLLSSLPLTVTQIVLGKFAAILCMIAIPTGAFCLFPIFLSFFGAVPMLTAYLGIVNLFLLGAAIAAVCVFIACQSDNLPAAAAISIGVLAVLFAVRFLLPYLPAGLSRVLSFLSLFGHMTALQNSVFEITVPLYYISFAVFFLFASVVVSDRRRNH